MKTLSLEKLENCQGGSAFWKGFCSTAIVIALIEPSPLGEVAVAGCAIASVNDWI